jgi:flagellar biosynthetic protein FlhB
MAEDNNDQESKTEEPSERKIRDTIEKGNLPFSKELSILASFVAILVFTVFIAQDSLVDLGSFLSRFLDRPEEWPISTAQDVATLYRMVLVELAKSLGGVLILLMAAGLAASALQNMPRLVLDRIQPKASRISLREGWKRLFGLQGFVEFGKSLGKLGFTAMFVMLALNGIVQQLLSGMITQPAEFAMVIKGAATHILVAITLVMTAVGGADLFWSRFKWRRDLRMTRQEVKDEFKQTDGDPIIKSRMRSLARDRARRRMIQAVPRATLVIANPTHFSIALRYMREETAAPIVVAKGQDLLALKIREIAAEHDIPVFEDVALARSMYKQVSVDSMIPPQFYQAVAELVRIVYRDKAAPASGKAAH